MAQTVKKSAWNAGDLGSIPGLGRSPGVGNGNLLQDSCLENFIDYSHKRIPGTNRRCKGKKCAGEEGFIEEEIPELRLESEKEVP